MEQTSKGYALITGASSGIGWELAKLFAADGYPLILVSRDAAELEAKARELSGAHGVEAVVIAKDLFVPQAATELYNEIKSRGLTVEVLVNNAGQGRYGLFVASDVARQLEIIQLNVTALVELTHHFLKDMVARNGGKILQLASIASEVPGPLQSVYHATKAFVLSFTQGLINELKDTGVTMTALQPGVTDTDFFNKADFPKDLKILEPDSMADPAKVAKDGYEALMKGDDKIVSGMKNKVMTTMSNVMPDALVAEQMRQMHTKKSDEKE
ncbi:SDR family NAD(P)-dependent oxidoreductase [Pseudocnuella soli]|uniref:SDR family NAD(P)-dependent oxidoreductase n=1 Tax=Pseudocnuella soli TaxID=2502779 RepID=UPI00104783C5|nr:SDR family oxidoreductase [Pseudocnuella soli]